MIVFEMCFFRNKTKIPVLSRKKTGEFISVTVCFQSLSSNWQLFTWRRRTRPCFRREVSTEIPSSSSTPNTTEKLKRTKSTTKTEKLSLRLSFLPSYFRVLWKSKSNLSLYLKNFFRYNFILISSLWSHRSFYSFCSNYEL